MAKQQSAAIALCLALSLTVLPKAGAATFILNNLLAQASTPAFPLPSAVPENTQVNINGSTSLFSINQALKQQFEARFPGTQINLAYDGPQEALQAVQNGSLDLAALGRPLTNDEKNQGLVAVPIARHKIALVVGPDNPFRGSLTIEQFAQIFRGEIRNWSELGGPDTPIRLIDRPDTSDTRQAFQTYQAFQSAPFTTSDNAIKLTEDTTEAVIGALGQDGISYAIAEQVLNNPAVQVLDMYGTLPSDPLYPFSQPLTYVYKGPNPSPAVQAFLGFATAEENRAAIEAARAQSTQQAPAPNATPSVEEGAPATPDGSQPASPPPATGEQLATPSAPTETESASESRWGFPWWWLLIPLVGAVLAWLILRNHEKDIEAIAEDESAEPDFSPDTATSTVDVKPVEGFTPVTDAASTIAPPPESPLNPFSTAAVATVGLAGVAATAKTTAQPGAAAATSERRVILVPRNCREAYVYWEVSDTYKAALRKQGGELFALRLYDVTDVDLKQQPPNRIQQFRCNEQGSDRHVPIPRDNREYIVELGYMTPDRKWLPLVRSSRVQVPAC